MDPAPQEPHPDGSPRAVIFTVTRSSAILLAIVLIAVFGVPVLGDYVPGFDRLADLYSKSSPRVQASLLAVLAALTVGVGVWGAFREGEAQRLSNQLMAVQRQVDALRRELTQHEDRMDHLLEVESRAGLWKREPTKVPPPFFPMAQRDTRFITVCNLKGGVGKTTLAANLAACLSSEDCRVLVIDVDFQGTLGAVSVDNALALMQRTHRAFVNKLLDEPPSSDLLHRLAVQMNGIPNANVILADFTLENVEFANQARYFVNPELDPRFQFRRHLHRSEVFDEYDIVIFDCPPRVTTSVVNAVTCSDFVLIPTKLDPGSIDAVPRTLSWLLSLGAIWQGAVLGVVANQVPTRSGFRTRAAQSAYEKLVEIAQHDRPAYVFESVIPETPRAVGQAGRIASVGADGRAVFSAVAEELRSRLYGNDNA